MANNIFLNYVHNALLHRHHTSTGKEFVNISFPCSQSKTGYASFSVNCRQVFPSTTRNGTPLNNYSNIILGKPDLERNVSVATNKKGTNWKTIQLTCQQIKESFENARDKYRNNQKAA